MRRIFAGRIVLPNKKMSKASLIGNNFFDGFLSQPMIARLVALDQTPGRERNNNSQFLGLYIKSSQ
jgi:hypothetical protein